MNINELKTARWLVDLLDNRFSIFGYKFGIDPLLGLFPVFGDLLAVLPGLYLLYLGRKNNIPVPLQRRMVTNIVLDFIVGSIPVLGFFADIVIKSNNRNIEILERHQSLTL